MSIGKSLRFELFARDGFVCQYCGQRPPDVVLELDHLQPRAKGGGDDPLNLVTSCFDCNRGKRDKVLGNIPRRPDADLKFLEIQQEIVEAERYLKAKSKRDQMHRKLVLALEETWAEWVDSDNLPGYAQFGMWIKRYGPEETETAIKLLAPRVDSFGDLSRYRNLTNASMYLSGILRKRFEEGDASDAN